MHALEMDLHLHMSDLSKMDVIRSCAMISALPVWGIIVDSKLRGKKALLAVSSAGWGITGILLALLSRGISGLLIFRFALVAFLASGIPITQTFIVTTIPQSFHGTAFGLVGIASGIGSIISFQLSTTISQEQFFGMFGWRVGLVGIGILSLIFSMLVCAFMSEPCKKGADDCEQESERLRSPAYMPATLMKNIRDFFKIKSFVILCVQGCFGTFSCLVLGFQVMYYQYCGLSNVKAGTVMSVGQAGSIIGSAVGGRLGDLMASWDPLHGRQYIAHL
eukprot:gnl/TRDRNA2_/TRDRNA2_162445_c0_seq1.p1 gnl/TRDRNA2_/TRDRNA2_162445_c0~~gnl/TRDRNA2_/TRDRNA2_162445_c0_seq1.p1  ORF type:complete len:277 (-),score=20.41 gnl/TRDRNA2_/TRDRNA2_162445_c0_seq1:15-845(-)